jgi:hypothetical protein
MDRYSHHTLGVMFTNLAIVWGPVSSGDLFGIYMGFRGFIPGYGVYMGCNHQEIEK